MNNTFVLLAWLFVVLTSLRYFCFAILAFVISRDLWGSLAPFSNVKMVIEITGLDENLSTVSYFGSVGAALFFYIKLSQKIGIKPSWAMVFFFLPFVGIWPFLHKFVEISDRRNSLVSNN